MRRFIPLFSRRHAHAISLLPFLGTITPSPPVVVNEIYYDHPGSDGGWEFVELFNTGEAVVPLDGYRLELVDGRTGSSRVLWNAAEGILLGPRNHLLVGGEGYGLGEAFTLLGAIENGPDAVRLLGPSGEEDIVGYGDLGEGGPFEGEPAEDVPPGSSLARRPDGRDTGHNGVDFVPWEPTPGVFNFHEIDIAVRLATDDLLPCANGPFELVVRIVNTGLSRAAGRVDLRAWVRGKGGLAGEWHGSATVDLPCGEIDSARIALVAAPEEMSLRVASRLAGDGNAANDTATCRVNVSPSVIVVNEIMYRPLRDGSEWVELFNVGTAPVNLCSWKIRDSSCSERTIASGDLFVEPGAYHVLARYPDRLVARHPSLESICSGVEGGWPQLNDGGSGGTADAIRLYDSAGMIVEHVAYADLVGAERERSIERISHETCSSVPGGIWHRCAAPSGSTPGSANSVGGAAGSGALSIDPNPFSIDGHGTTLVSALKRPGETGFVIRIFTIDGIEVRRLLGESGGAAAVSCRWDGRDDGGRAVGTGLYVCLVEYVAVGGRVCRRQRCCIAVVGSCGG